MRPETGSDKHQGAESDSKGKGAEHGDEENRETADSEVGEQTAEAWKQKT
ncbi:MAG TPA: hypothetical protein VM492_09780 [Sumerlaeia bacterium]|nr:hypothetical protein [Sumerlaeia bacterium]